MLASNDNGANTTDEDKEDKHVLEIIAGSSEEREFIESTMAVWKVSTELG